VSVLATSAQIAQANLLDTPPLGCTTPGCLAQRLDPSIVQTPMLDVIDDHLLAVRDHTRVMFDRRARLLALLQEGMDEKDAIAEAASLVPSAGIDRLHISAPPQEGKSERTTRTFVEWMLQQFPTLRIGVVSFDGTNATRFSYEVRSDIELFNGQHGNVDLGLRLARDQKAMGRWTLDSGGGVYAIGIGGGLTGRPLDLLIIDDPVKDPQAADSLLRSEQAWDWWFAVARPRLAPWAPVIVVQTRWHEDDLMGRMQRTDEPWVVLNVPAQCEDPATDPLGRGEDEWLVSARGRTPTLWQALKDSTPIRWWNALYQGHPAPLGGAVWLREWWRRYDDLCWSRSTDGSYSVPGYDVRMSWDLTFIDTKGSDFVAGGVWAKRGAESRLLYVLHARMLFTEAVDAIRRLRWLFPECGAIFIERAANGEATLAVLRKEIPGVIGVNPRWGSKPQRAEAAQPFIRAGNIALPTGSLAVVEPGLTWDVEGYIAECTAFPRGTHDDQVDMTSQYVTEVYIRGGEMSVSVPDERLPDARPHGAQRRLAAGLSPVQHDLTRRVLGR
jgi:predicted phage terminase large subunit-like protein